VHCLEVQRRRLAEAAVGRIPRDGAASSVHAFRTPGWTLQQNNFLTIGLLNFVYLMKDTLINTVLSIANSKISFFLIFITTTRI
jgi:hypothetical protein